jgi:hypothetical protein
MKDADRVAVEKELAILGHSVACVLADIRLELLALRNLLIERGVIQPESVTEKAASLRDSLIPRLTAETSGDLRVHFERLCQQVGIES